MALERMPHRVYKTTDTHRFRLKDQIHSQSCHTVLSVPFLDLIFISRKNSEKNRPLDMVFSHLSDFLLRRGREYDIILIQNSLKG